MVTAAEARSLTEAATKQKEEQARPEAMRILEVLMGKIANSANNGDYSIIYDNGDYNIIYDRVQYYVDSLVVANLRGLGYKVESIQGVYLISW